MKNVFSARAFAICQKDWGENDLLFCLLTDNFGKIWLLANGAKKIKSKLSGHLQGFGLNEVNFVQGGYHKRLVQSCLVEKFTINSEWDGFFLQSFLEILEKVLPEGESIGKFFEYCLKSIKRILEEKDFLKKSLLYSVFLIKLISFLGYEISEAEKQIKSGGGVNNQTIQKFIVAVKNYQTGVGELSLPIVNQKPLFVFLQDFLEYHVEKKLNSLGFLSKFMQ